MIPVLTALALQAAAAPGPIDYGAKPAFEEAVRIGEAFVKATLKDPYSAQFEWPYDFVPFTEKVPMFKRTTGYATCFSLNAKNSYGGYVGARMHRIVIRDGKVIDYSEVSALKIVPDECKALETKFGMGPAPSH